MNKKTAVMGIWIIMMGLYACQQPDDALYQLDQESMQYLQLFFDQEKAFAEALTGKDSVQARAQLDTMQLIVLLFWETANFEHRTIPQEDSVFFAAKRDLWQWMAVLSDSVYPEIMEKALLPRVKYTHTMEQKLTEIIARNDSILNTKLENLRKLRQDFSGLRNYL